MKIFPLIILLFLFKPAFGQKKDCFCDKDTLMNEATVSCDVVNLKNKAKLYWQYNCDRIWLTLEQNNGDKTVLDDLDVVFYGYAYRLGFHLVKEYQGSLLFRSGCPANGPCVYTLIHKETGVVIAKFGQLICIDTDSYWEGAYPYSYDFLVYFSDNYDALEIYYPDSGKIKTIPFNAARNGLTAVIPEHQFEKMTLNGDLLTLNYRNDKNKIMTQKVNLRNTKYKKGAAQKRP